MTFPTRKGSSLVDLANDQTLLIYATVIGDSDGPPRWVQLTAHGTDRWPATRLTVVRADCEDCSSLWARVLRALRQLKRDRGFQHGVLVHCRMDAPPADAAQADTRFNLQRALWLDVDRERDAGKRVKALCMLAELSEFRGEIPAFQ